MEFLVRFSQTYETFRIAELESLAVSAGVELKIKTYNSESPFCIVGLASAEVAQNLVKRSILIKSIHELWGTGSDYPSLHDNVKASSSHLWPFYKTGSFRFAVDSFQGSRSMAEQRELVEACSYLGFEGPIRMKKPDHSFTLHEEWIYDSEKLDIKNPKTIFLTRDIGSTERDAILKYDLKKRKYISTTSMDSELALITANICLAGPGKLFYDPFVGTGSFPIACAHFGAMPWGSDIDGRSIRGKGKTGLITNFEQYGLKSLFGDSFVADLTNTPIRATRFLDGIVCDPPYGVREGLKVLGSRNPELLGKMHMLDGKPSHTQPGYIPPKKPYGFLAMLDDILDFAALSLVDNGRLSMWVPTSNEADEEVKTPVHPYLELVSVCTQTFNKWSRKLITYRRISNNETPNGLLRERRLEHVGINADDLNPFRKRYFEGFKTPDENVDL